MKKIALASIIAFLFVFVTNHKSVAQEEDLLGNWLMYFGANKISEKTSLHTEIQYRNHTAAPINIEQLLLRTGVNYHLNKDAFVTLGYAHITGYDYESPQRAPESTEHRIWQQLIMNNYVGRVKFEHRYRIEQRWVNSNYRNRFRYRVMAFVPLNKPKMEPGAWFLGLYDEVFVNGEIAFTPFFDRNRLYGAVGYNVSKSTNFQVGMLNQRVNAFGKWYLQFAVIFNPDLRKSE